MNEFRGPLDDRMAMARADVETDIEQLPVPAFTPNRRAVPAMLAVVMLIGLGALGLFLTGGDDGEAITVANPPEPTAVPTEVEQLPEDTPVAQALGEPTTEPASSSSGRDGQLTQAGAGSFYLPTSNVNAWNADASRILLYRTGDAGPGHVVIDASSGDVLFTVPVSPPDIEQLYWHPVNPSELVYGNEATIMSFDTVSMTETELYTFSGCDAVDSGRWPSPPATDGTIGLLCHTESGVEAIAYNLLAGTEARGPIDSDIAPLASPSGNFLIAWKPDGQAAVLDAMLAPTGVQLDLENNAFAVLTDGAGREYAAATLFSAPWIGSLVLLPLDGGTPQVIIGPDRGDAFPPPGNSIAASGSHVVLAIDGADDGALAGRVHVLDFSESLDDPMRLAIPHGTEGLNDYWSGVFVSVNPAGEAMYSSDSGTDRVNTFVLAPIDSPEG